jgi:WD40 repeat protein
VEGLASELAWQPDWKRLYTLKRHWNKGAVDQGVLEVDVATGKVLRKMPLDWREASSALAVSLDGRWFATGGANAPLRLFDLASGKESFYDPEPTPLRLGGGGRSPCRVQSLTFSPDCRLLAECNGDNGLLRLWDVRGKTCIRKIRPVERFPETAVFSPDGSVLGVLSRSGKIELIETESGTAICDLAGSRFHARSVAFSHDGRFLVAGGKVAAPPPMERTRVWDLASGKQVAEWKGAHPAVSPDGRWLATVEEQGTTIVWDARQIFPTPALALSNDDLVRFWDELLSPRQIQAYKAVWSLVGCPERAVPFLRTRLLALRWPEGAKVAGLVRRLDSDAFADRQDAESTLERMGAASASFLRYQLTRKPSLEAHRRIERVLARMAHLEVPAKRRQAEHAIRALELMGTPAARSVLQELAGPGSLAGVQLEATAALARLNLRVTSRKP